MEFRYIENLPVAKKATSDRFQSPIEITTSPDKVGGGSSQDSFDVKQVDVKRLEDGVNFYVSGILIMPNGVIVIDETNRKHRLYEHNSYDCCFAIDSIIITCGISRVIGHRFVTCGESKVLWWTAREKIIVHNDPDFEINQEAYAIHFSGNKYYIVNTNENVITVFDVIGKQERKIGPRKLRTFGKCIKYGPGIYSDVDTQNIYLVCRDIHGVLCLSRNGDILWFYETSFISSGITANNDRLLFAVSDGVMALTRDGRHCSYFLKDRFIGHYIDALGSRVAITGLGPGFKIKVFHT